MRAADNALDELPGPLQVYVLAIRSIERDYRAEVLLLQQKRQAAIDDAAEVCKAAMHDPRGDPAT